ncbi:hypothetical protein DY000_02029679 [Brassica cretica]|uniref:Uncharacterized protein n=1 Tax=Brassica cretica TaxID=69181 RepID=A0ABQ7DLC1_BRACR|nr:hypothetical protein DY000_02029679 [Brassica cretica]
MNERKMSNGPSRVLVAHPAAVIKFNCPCPPRMFLAVNLAARGTMTTTTAKIISLYTYPIFTASWTADLLVLNRRLCCSLELQTTFLIRERRLLMV